MGSTGDVGVDSHREYKFVEFTVVVIEVILPANKYTRTVNRRDRDGHNLGLPGRREHTFQISSMSRGLTHPWLLAEFFICKGPPKAVRKFKHARARKRIALLEGWKKTYKHHWW